MDALGAASYSDEEVQKFLQLRETVLDLLSKKMEGARYGINRRNIEVFTFNDTVLITCKTTPKSELLPQIVWFFVILRYFFVHSLSHNILLRGAVGIGTFYVNKESNTVMGQAVADAAAWYDKADWIGIHATPKATLIIKSLAGCEPHTGIMWDYSVPLKDGRAVPVVAVNWPTAFCGLREQSSQRVTGDLLDLLCRQRVPFGTEAKYLNTLEFFRSIVREEEKE